MYKSRNSRRRLVGSVIALVAIVCAGSVRAELFEIAGRKYTVKKDHISKSEPAASLYSLLNAQLWNDTLEDVQGRLGSAALLPRAEHQAKKICFRSNDEGDGVVVIFYADSSGSWRRITGFRLSTVQESGVDSKMCQLTKALSKNTSLGGTTIGASKQALRTALGKPSAELQSSELRVYEFKEKLSSSELSRLEASFPELRQHPFLSVTLLIHSEYKEDRLSALEVHVVKELPSE